MICTGCEVENAPGAHTCARCGWALEPSPSTPAPVRVDATGGVLPVTFPAVPDYRPAGFWEGGPPVTGPPELRRVTGVGTATTALLAAGVALTVVSILAELSQVGLLRQLQADETAVADSKLVASDIRIVVTGVAQTGVRVATIVLFLVWFYRVYRNAEGIFRYPMRHSHGWAVGSWFVPFLNFVRPIQMIYDAWRGSRPHDGGDHVPAVFGLWWALWLVLYPVERMASQQTLRAETAEEYISASHSTVFANTVQIAAALGAIVVVRRLTGRQRERGVEFAQVV